MGSTFFGLDIALTGLYTSNLKLNTTAHNIANAETEGYSRQIVNSQAGKALQTYTTYGMVGTGVEVTGINQVRNPYYDLKYWKTNTLTGEYETKDYYVNSVQNYFNEINEGGFTTTFDKFYNALDELGNDPSSLEKREQVSQLANAFTDYFNYMSDSLHQVQTDLNFELKNAVDSINHLAEELATITLKINTLEVSGDVANDLRDQRNVLIDKLSKYCTVEVEEKIVNKSDISLGQQMYTVKIDGQVLVDTYEFNKLKYTPRTEKANQNDIEGLYDISWTTDGDSGQTFNMYSGSLGGVLQGLVEMRDGNNLENLYGSVKCSEGDMQITMKNTSINSISKLNIPETGYITLGGLTYKYTGFTGKITKNEQGSDSIEYTFDLEKPIRKDVDTNTARIGQSVDYKGVTYYMGQLNEFLRTFADKFNNICNDAEDLNGDKGTDFFVYKDVVTGEEHQLDEYEDIDTFTSSSNSYYKLNVGNIKVSTIMVHDPKKFPAADDIDMGVENNIKLRQLIGLKSDVTLFKQGRPSSFLQTLVSEIGVDASAAKSFSENQNTILQSIDKQRLADSGVDTDEEAMNLITYQNMYQLNAKVVTMMNQIFNSLINELGK